MLKNLLLHLRLNLSLVLAPVFLWGYFLSGGGNLIDFLLAFLAYHVFLYGGSNAYNSFYDQDEGPIGGLYNPPPATKSLLYFSLFCKFGGLFLSLLVNNLFFLTYLAFFILSVLYSYPKTRLKANPYLSSLTVAFGQGGIAFAAGWFSGTQIISDFAVFILGMLTTIFMCMGTYPLTQLYQIEEDQKRNDRTFAVYWGIKNSFRFSLICTFFSFASMLSVLYLLGKYFDLLLIFLFYSTFFYKVLSWSKGYKPEEIIKNYQKIMRINYLNGFGFTFYIIASIFLDR